MSLTKHIDYLKNILFKNKISQLLIKTEYDEAGEYLNLTLIKIKPSQQNKGYDEAVLDNIISYADKYNVRIKINIQGLNKKGLIEFYRKHNFVLIKNHEMVYYPKSNNLN